METLREYIDLIEEYEASVYKTYTGAPKKGAKEYPVYKNPTPSEIKEIRKISKNVRFLVFNNELYAWPDKVMHEVVAKHLNTSHYNSGRGYATIHPTGMLIDPIFIDENSSDAFFQKYPSVRKHFLLYNIEYD